MYICIYFMHLTTYIDSLKFEIILYRECELNHFKCLHLLVENTIPKYVPTPQTYYPPPRKHIRPYSHYSIIPWSGAKSRHTAPVG